MHEIHATTAMFPGTGVRDALAQICAGASEPLLGTISAAHVQLCPQNMGTLTERSCEELRAEYQNSQLRLHANARVLAKHHILDASTFNDESRPYYAALADRSRRLGARAYSLHAGRRSNCTLAQMIDNVARIQDIFGEITVAVEGLYPNSAVPQLMDSWAEYETVQRAAVPMAVDVSHLKIVDSHESGQDRARIVDLLSSQNTIEVHLSDNDARTDRHNVLVNAPWWWAYRQSINPAAVVFTEGNQLRSKKVA